MRRTAKLILISLALLSQSCDRRTLTQKAWDDKVLLNASKMEDLLKQGLNPNLETSGTGYKDFLLLRATKYRAAGTVEVLLRYGADPSKRSWGYHKTPLFQAASDGSIDIIQLLLDAGADVNAVDDRGNNALREAALGKHPNVVKLLCEIGANPWHANQDGETMVSIARKYSTPEIVTLLESKPKL